MQSWPQTSGRHNTAYWLSFFDMGIIHYGPRMGRALAELAVRYVSVMLAGYSDGDIRDWG